jgi:hypothetical protein
MNFMQIDSLIFKKWVILSIFYEFLNEINQLSAYIITNVP